MVRRLTLLAIASLSLGLGTLAGPAMAQNSPSPTTIPATTSTTVAPTTTTTEQVSPTTIERTTTTEAAIVTTTQGPTTSVAGVVVARPLPRTGNDFGVQVIVGAGLTAAGLAFAVSARLRRSQASASA